MTLTEQEQSDILKYFGKPLLQMQSDEFQELKRRLFAKYHPDKFQHYEDEVVLALMNDQFQKISDLCSKMEVFFGDKNSVYQQEINSLKVNSVFAANALPFEIITKDKDLKYKLLETHYRLIRRADKIHIKGTQGYLYIEEDHVDQKIGFSESLKLFLTFKEEDHVELIAEWLYKKLAGTDSKLLINKQLVQIDYFQIITMLLRTTRKLLS
ncbi:MAG: hypothetical protein IPO27_08335 [Bacteroidetes bacterium]|nr:hypothetical protein [Bacteroidota bacterium]